MPLDDILLEHSDLCQRHSCVSGSNNSLMEGLKVSLDLGFLHCSNRNIEVTFGSQYSAILTVRWRFTYFLIQQLSDRRIEDPIESQSPAGLDGRNKVTVWPQASAGLQYRDCNHYWVLYFCITLMEVLKIHLSFSLLQGTKYCIGSQPPVGFLWGSADTTGSQPSSLCWMEGMLTPLGLSPLYCSDEGSEATVLSYTTTAL